MRTVVFAAVALLVVLPFAALFAALAFSAPQPPPTMASVSNPFAGADFSALPPKRSFTARDGTALAYRLYDGDSKRTAILIHGSSGTTASMHFVAMALQTRGMRVLSLATRGHDGTGRSGDIDYAGQLGDDMTDFLKTLGPRAAGETRTLVGFSSGGGFALRLAGGPLGKGFDRLILIAPQFPHDAPTARSNAGGWVSLALPRIVALSILNRFGITAFDGLPVLALAVDRTKLAQTGLTPVYSFRMLRAFGPSDDYLGDLARAPMTVRVLVGGSDEIFRADAFAPLVKSARPDATVTVVPGLGHMAMTLDPRALAAIADAAD